MTPPSCALLGGFTIGHGLRCYGNITRTRNVREYMLVFALCLVGFRGEVRRVGEGRKEDGRGTEGSENDVMGLGERSPHSD